MWQFRRFGTWVKLPDRPWEQPGADCAAYLVAEGYAPYARIGYEAVSVFSHEDGTFAVRLLAFPYDQPPCHNRHGNFVSCQDLPAMLEFLRRYAIVFAEAERGEYLMRSVEGISDQIYQRGML